MSEQVVQQQATTAREWYGDADIDGLPDPEYLIDGLIETAASTVT